MCRRRLERSFDWDGAIVGKSDRAFIDLGRPDGSKSSYNHVGYRLNIEGLNHGEIRISITVQYETHVLSSLVPDEAKI